MLQQETLVVYVINQRFLRPLKVLRYSLMRQGSLQNCPFIVLTTSPKVSKDRFLRRTAAEVRLVGEAELSRFDGMRTDLTSQTRGETFAWKFTFLKLLAFGPMGFKRHVLMDADMICLNPLDEELLAQDYAVKAVREFGASTFPIREEKVRESHPERALAYVADHEQAREAQLMHRPTYNSGLLVLQGDAIGDDIVEEAIREASQTAYPGDQALSNEILSRRGVPFLELPIWYNARRRIFESLGEDFFAQRRGDVKLLHFTPGKPWNVPSEDHYTFDREWTAVRDEAVAWADDIAVSMT